MILLVMLAYIQYYICKRYSGYSRFAIPLGSLLFITAYIVLYNSVNVSFEIQEFVGGDVLSESTTWYSSFRWPGLINLALARFAMVSPFVFIITVIFAFVIRVNPSFFTVDKNGCNNISEVDIKNL